MYTEVVMGDVVVLETIRLAMATVPLEMLVMTFAADVPTFL